MKTLLTICIVLLILYTFIFSFKLKKENLHKKLCNFQNLNKVKNKEYIVRGLDGRFKSKNESNK